MPTPTLECLGWIPASVNMHHGSQEVMAGHLVSYHPQWRPRWKSDLQVLRFADYQGKKKTSANWQEAFVGGKSILRSFLHANKGRGKVGNRSDRHAKKHAGGFYSPPDTETGVGATLVVIRSGNASQSASLVHQGSVALVTCRLDTASPGAGLRSERHTGSDANSTHLWNCEILHCYQLVLAPAIGKYLESKPADQRCISLSVPFSLPFK